MTDPVIGLDDPHSLARTIDAYVAGSAMLTGLELYYELERSTSLVMFHTMLRPGARNRARSGLQQSYGDHNRLLMLGLDKLVEGDVEWYRSRIDPAEVVSDGSLEGCLHGVAALGLARDTLVALWLAAALHDCGMLCGHGAHVDVEDGVVLSRPILEALCPEPLRDLATFVLHHHDYIKGVFLGEVPTGLVTTELAALPYEQRAVAMVALGCVQVAGAASLGEGRLGPFRIDVFRRCLAGTALDDGATSTRLARLLEATPRAAEPLEDVARAELEHHDPRSRAVLEQFLERSAVHGWQRVTVDLTPSARTALVMELAERWAESDADHVVFDDQFDPGPATLDLDRARCHVETTLSGITLLTVGP